MEGSTDVEQGSTADVHMATDIVLQDNVKDNSQQTEANNVSIVVINNEPTEDTNNHISIEVKQDKQDIESSKDDVKDKVTASEDAILVESEVDRVSLKDR